MRIAKAAFLFLIALAVGAAAPVGPVKYTYTAIDYPGAQHTGVYGINRSGQISGTFFGAKGIAHAFTYAAGKFTLIDYPDAERSLGFGIDDAGRVVGYFEKNDVIRGFLFEAGKFTAIDYPKARVTRAYGINGSGQIVGAYQDTQHGNPHGFLLSEGKFTAIDYPGATRTEAFGINDSGQIVGYYVDSVSTVHGFLDKAGVLTTVDFPGAQRTNLYGVSNTGQVAGSFIDTNRSHGFVDNSGYVKLNYPGATSTFGFALNGSGQAVGQYVDQDGAGHGFVATVGERQAPQISRRFDPEAIPSGLGEFRLKVRGVGFAPGAVLQWNDLPRPTTFVDSSLLTAMIPASDTAKPGTAFLKVVNPNPDGATSNVVGFIVTPPGPQ
jgi:uncharacterized membrane protein